MKRVWLWAPAIGFVLSAAAAFGGVTSAEVEQEVKDVWSRPTLTGIQPRLSPKGISIDASLTQVTQGVVGGGKSHDWEYGGRGDVMIDIDTQKLGLWPGGFFSLEVEGNYNESVNSNTGSLMAPNTNQLFPMPAGENLNIPQLTFAQFLSTHGGLIAGKFDTMSADNNAFAHGKGDQQFFNLALSINPVALSVPYSTLGAGIIMLPTADPDEAILQFLALQASGKASTSGFEDFESDQWIGAGEGRVRTGFFGMTGHQLVGALYSSRTFTALDQRLGTDFRERGLATNNGTWSVYYNFDQYLYEIDRKESTGVGVFFRFGASDGDPNPMQYFFSGGIGGKGLIPGRSLDRFGVGVYYLDVSSIKLRFGNQTRSFLGNESGFEAFYNIAITPWLLFTPDIQVIDPSQRRELVSVGNRKSIDTTTVVGFRLQTVF